MKSTRCSGGWCRLVFLLLVFCVSRWQKVRGEDREPPLLRDGEQCNFPAQCQSGYCEEMVCVSSPSGGGGGGEGSETPSPSSASGEGVGSPEQQPPSINDSTCPIPSSDDFSFNLSSFYFGKALQNVDQGNGDHCSGIEPGQTCDFSCPQYVKIGKMTCQNNSGSGLSWASGEAAFCRKLSVTEACPPGSYRRKPNNASNETVGVCTSCPAGFITKPDDVRQIELTGTELRKNALSRQGSEWNQRIYEYATYAKLEAYGNNPPGESGEWNYEARKATFAQSGAAINASLQSNNPHASTLMLTNLSETLIPLPNHVPVGPGITLGQMYVNVACDSCQNWYNSMNRYQDEEGKNYCKDCTSGGEDLMLDPTYRNTLEYCAHSGDPYVIVASDPLVEDYETQDRGDVVPGYEPDPCIRAECYLYTSDANAHLSVDQSANVDLDYWNFNCTDQCCDKHCRENPDSNTDKCQNMRLETCLPDISEDEDVSNSGSTVSDTSFVRDENQHESGEDQTEEEASQRQPLDMPLSGVAPKQLWRWGSNQQCVLHTNVCRPRMRTRAVPLTANAKRGHEVRGLPQRIHVLCANQRLVREMPRG